METLPRRDGPIPTRQEVLACQISSWYPTFSSLPRNTLSRTKATVRTVFLDLPDDFRQYLLADDGVQLPDGAKTSSLLAEQHEAEPWSDDENEENDHGTQPEPRYSFPALDDQIQTILKELGGSVAPKLNWSAPKDAVWMNGGSLKCQTPGDIYLLLKSSDFCLYDLLHALQDIQDPQHHGPDDLTWQLALRKWCHFFPSQEFRCFVRGHELLAISQRHDSQHFPHLLHDQFVMRSILVEFFDEIVQNKFAGGTVDNYIFDAYIDKNEKVWLLDFNVWGRRTDTLLFGWDELETMDCDLPEIRVVAVDKQVRADPLASYRAPVDTLYVASLTDGGSKSFQQFMALCGKPSERDDDSTDNV